MNLQSYRRAVRWIAALLFFIIPFIKIHGESLLRFDLKTLKLFFFGKIIWIEDFFLILLLIFAAVFLFISVTQLFGRVWCGWLCPQTVVIDFTSRMFTKKRLKKLKIPQYIGTAVFSIAISACLIWYFVSPYQFMDELINLNMNKVTLWFWVVISAVTCVNFMFFRRGFCTTVCPYAKLQGIMFDKHTMAISMYPDRKSECIKCLSCVKTCPTNIDIRDGFSQACINCAECAEACGKVMAGRGKTSLIGYIYGLNNEPKFFRPSVLITGSLFVIFCILFTVRLVFSSPFDFEIFPAQKFMPAENHGKIINGFEIRLSNKTGKDMELELSIPDVEGYELQPQADFKLAAGESVMENLYIILPEDAFGKYSVRTIKVIARTNGEKPVSISAEAGFRKPIKRKK